MVLLLYATALHTKNIFIIINSFASRLLRMGMEKSISFSRAGNLGLFLVAQQWRALTRDGCACPDSILKAKQDFSSGVFPGWEMLTQTGFSVHC